MIRFLNVVAVIDAASGGGAAERSLQLTRALANEGVIPTLLTLDTGFTEPLKETDGARVVSLRCLQKRFLIPAPQRDKLAEIVRDADIVQLTNHWTLLNAMVYGMARKLGKPYIVCPAGALPIFGRSRRLKKIYNLLVGKQIVRNARGWVAITELERAQFAAYGVEPSRVTLIPNGVWADPFPQYDEAAFRRRFDLGAQPFILFMGRLNPIKGPDILLEAFAQLKHAGDHHLVFAGPDEGLQRPLENLAAARGIKSRVHFTGYVSGPDKAAAYHAAELVVVPSRQEAMSIVALEAGACGKAVLLTDRCGFDEVASAGGGQVVAARPDAMAQALDRLLPDRERLRAMGENLSALVRARYTWPGAAQHYVRLFDSILKQAPCAS